MTYLIVKWAHILSATLLFGTGLGTAFYMFCVNRSRDVRAIAVVSRYVVLADWLFTTPTVIIQPITGAYLAFAGGVPVMSGWVLVALALYCFIGACWLPVVWLQIKMRDMARDAVAKREELPPRYWQFERWWSALGIPAFLGMLVIYYLMVFKPL